MRLAIAAFLLDENIHPEVARFLRSQGLDVVDVRSVGLGGSSDREILARAHSDGRAVLTHDSDFGTLTIASGEPVTGVVYLRPGHIESAKTIETLRVLFEQAPAIDVPFFVVAERRGTKVRIRIRSLPDLSG